jgi:hypothetical protein
MTILEQVIFLQKRVRATGDYKRLAPKIGVSYHWLQKFAGGHMPNPTLDNVSKVEKFFRQDDQFNNAA